MLQDKLNSRKNKRSPEFKKMFASLPKEIQELAHETYRKFIENHSHPSLRHHQLKKNQKGQHREGSFAVCIARRYRAIYDIEGGINLWYWISSHENYNNFTGKRN